MKKIVTGIVAIALMLSFSVAFADTTFNTNLTVGSKGADVTALQTILISKGYLAISAPTGYFGTLTKTAVAKWQAASGISPAVGYFGPISRAAINSMSTGGTTSTVPGCAAGAMFSSTTGAACTTTTSTVPGCAPGALFSSTTGVSCASVPGSTTTTGITTPGAEGILTVTSGPVASTNVNVGQTQVPVIAVRAQAQNSDIAIQRIQLNLGTDARIYTKIYSGLSVVDSNGTLLATVALNPTTVVSSGNNYYVNLTGFSYVVPKGTSRDLTVKANLYPSIDSTLTTQSGTGQWTITVDANSVRGVDGAGVNEYGPSVAFSQIVVIGASLVDNAKLNVSTDSTTPLVNAVIATQGGSSNQYSQLPVLVFDLNADKDSITVKNLTANVTLGGNGTATATAAYIYDGATLVGSASVSGGVATFSNINYVIPQNTTKVLTLKADIQSAGGNTSTFTGSTGTFTAQNSQGSSVTVSGSATGNAQWVTSVGPQITLNGITTSTSKSSATSGQSTTTLSATFNLNIAALGDALTFGLSGSTTPSFGTTTAFVNVYKNGVVDASLSSYSPTVTYSVPSSGAVTSGQNFVVAKGNTVSVPVTYNILVGGAQSTNNYSIQLSGVRYATSSGNGTAISNFMDTQSAWRTTNVTLP